MGKRVIVIAGPTASGKSEIAFRLAKELHSEIISADSRQLYRFLDIGTAKPPGEYLETIPHHLIDILNPDENFSASDFENKSLSIIREMHSRDIIPIVAGGTGLYIRALSKGIFDIEPDLAIREELMREREKYGNLHLYEKLTILDRITAESMLPQNWKRVIRALEVKMSTGRSIRELQADYKRESEFEICMFGISPERGDLYTRINNRVDEMMAAGLVDEVLSLKDKGYTPDLNSLNTVGYKEIFNFLNGSYSLEEAVRLIKRNTRHYAKRQLTWFRAEKSIRWLDYEKNQDSGSMTEKILSLIH